MSTLPEHEATPARREPPGVRHPTNEVEHMSESTRSAPREPVPGHPGIYRKGGAYQVRWRHHGRERTRSFQNLTAAKRFKRQADAGDTQPTSRQPFNVYARQWLDGYRGRTSKGVSSATMAGYRDAVERFAVPYFGSTALDRLDPPALRRYIDHLAGKGLARNSVKAAYAPVRAMLGSAFDDGLLTTNPAAGVRVLVADNRPTMPKWLSAEQTAALLAEIPAAHADLVYLLASTGLRISEALAVRWADLRLLDGTPTLAVTRSKTTAGLRTVTLSPEAMRRLTRRRAVADFAADDDLVFPTRVGTEIDQRNFRAQVFRPAAERAGVPWATPHKLRHGLASLMASRGLSAPQIAAQLGHADGGVTAMRVYTHPEVVAVDFIDDALSQ